MLNIPRSWTISSLSNKLYKWSDDEQLAFSKGRASFCPEFLMLGFNWKDGGELWESCDTSDICDW